MEQREALLDDQLGQYRVIRWLSSGSRCDLYLAYDVESEDVVVLKVSRTPTSRADIKSLEWAMRAASSLQRSDIVLIRDYGLTSSDRLYLVTEAIKGQSLEAVLASLARKGRPLAAGVALRLIRQVAVALKSALAIGIVHKNLQPEQIVMRPDGSPALLGLDNPAPPLRDSESPYLSPEQKAGQTLDARSNIYSLGVMLYELLTGRPRLDGEAAASLETLRPELAPETHELVETALVEQGWARYQTIDDLIAAIDEALAYEIPGYRPPVAAGPAEALARDHVGTLPALLEALRQPGKTRRALVLAFAILVLGLFGGMALVLSASDRLTIDRDQGENSARILVPAEPRTNTLTPEASLTPAAPQPTEATVEPTLPVLSGSVDETATPTRSENDSGTATASALAPVSATPAATPTDTATPTETSTPTETATPVPPTLTPSPQPTETPVPPRPTVIRLTATPVPPTLTPVPPTDTPPPPPPPPPPTSTSPPPPPPTATSPPPPTPTAPPLATATSPPPPTPTPPLP